MMCVCTPKRYRQDKVAIMAVDCALYMRIYVYRRPPCARHYSHHLIMITRLYIILYERCAKRERGNVFFYPHEEHRDDCAYRSLINDDRRHDNYLTTKSSNGHDTCCNLRLLIRYNTDIPVLLANDNAVVMTECFIACALH